MIGFFKKKKLNIVLDIERDIIMWGYRGKKVMIKVFKKGI